MKRRPKLASKTTQVTSQVKEAKPMCNEVTVEIGRLMLNAFTSNDNEGASETFGGESDTPCTDHESRPDDSITQERKPQT